MTRTPKNQTANRSYDTESMQSPALEKKLKSPYKDISPKKLFSPRSKSPFKNYSNTTNVIIENEKLIRGIENIIENFSKIIEDKTKFESLKIKFAAIKAQNTKLIEKIQFISNKSKRYEESRNKKADEIVNLKESIVILKSRYNKRKNLIQLVEQKNIELENLLIKLEERNNFNENQIQQLQQELCVQKEEILNLQKEQENNKNQIEEQNNNIKAKDETIVNLQTEIENLKKELEEKNIAIAANINNNKQDSSTQTSSILEESEDDKNISNTILETPHNRNVEQSTETVQEEIKETPEENIVNASEETSSEVKKEDIIEAPSPTQNNSKFSFTNFKEAFKIAHEWQKYLVGSITSNTSKLYSELTNVTVELYQFLCKLVGDKKLIKLPAVIKGKEANFYFSRGTKGVNITIDDNGQYNINMPAEYKCIVKAPRRNSEEYDLLKYNNGLEDIIFAAPAPTLENSRIYNIAVENKFINPNNAHTTEIYTQEQKTPNLKHTQIPSTKNIGKVWTNSLNNTQSELCK